MIKIGKVIGDVIEAGGVKNVTNNYYDGQQPKSEGKDLHLEKDTETDKEIVNQLKPIFYGNEEEARAFLASIQGMKPTQITAKVNELVNNRKISALSKNRDLWTVLHDAGIYDKSESNWNMQVN